VEHIAYIFSVDGSLLISYRNPNFRKGDCSACCLPQTDFLLGLFFYNENGGDIFLRNAGSLSMDYTALYPSRQDSLSAMCSAYNKDKRRFVPVMPKV
jgi:hypothetical protein